VANRIGGPPYRTCPTCDGQGVVAEPTQRVRKVRANTADVECLACGTVQRVDRDEDGDASIEQWPCQGSDECTARLCSECRVQCIACGLWSCAEHIEDRECEICRSTVLGVIPDTADEHLGELTYDSDCKEEASRG
jgi:hypothetical protein